MIWGIWAFSVSIVEAIMDLGKYQMMTREHHADHDYTWLALLESIINSLGCFCMAIRLAVGLGVESELKVGSINFTVPQGIYVQSSYVGTQYKSLIDLMSLFMLLISYIYIWIMTY